MEHSTSTNVVDLCHSCISDLLTLPLANIQYCNSVDTRKYFLTCLCEQVIVSMFSRYVMAFTVC